MIKVKCRLQNWWKLEVVWLKLYNKHFVDSYQIYKCLAIRMKELSIDDIGMCLYMSLCGCYSTKLYQTSHHLKLNIMYSNLNQIKMRKWNRYHPNLCQLNISSFLFVNGTFVYSCFINISFVCNHSLVNDNFVCYNLFTKVHVLRYHFLVNVRLTYYCCHKYPCCMLPFVLQCQLRMLSLVHQSINIRGVCYYLSVNGSCACYHLFMNVRFVCYPLIFNIRVVFNLLLVNFSLVCHHFFYVSFVWFHLFTNTHVECYIF